MPRFMYSSAAELEAADQYREAGLPYILTNIPTLDASRALWESDGYIQHQFDAQSRHDYQVLRSENTRFLYHGPVLTFINFKKKKPLSHQHFFNRGPCWGCREPQNTPPYRHTVTESAAPHQRVPSKSVARYRCHLSLTCALGFDDVIALSQQHNRPQQEADDIKSYRQFEDVAKMVGAKHADAPASDSSPPARHLFFLPFLKANSRGHW